MAGIVKPGQRFTYYDWWNPDTNHAQTDHLEGWFPFFEGGGETARTVFGYPVDADLDSFNVATAWGLNQNGSTLSFDGVDGRVLAPITAIWNLGLHQEWCMCFAVQIDDLLQSNKYAYQYSSGPTQHAIIFGFESSQFEFFGSNSFQGDNPRNGSQILIPDTNWHQVAYSYAPGSWRGYLDGKQVFDVASTFGFTTPASEFVFGGSAGGSQMECELQDWRLYSRSLDDVDLQDIIADPWAPMRRNRFSAKKLEAVPTAFEPFYAHPFTK